MSDAIHAALEKARDLLEWSRDNFEMDHADAVLLEEAIDEATAILDADAAKVAAFIAHHEPKTNSQ